MGTDKKIKPKKCKQCGEIFFPFRSTQIVCSIPCAFVYANEQRLKKEKKEWSQEKKQRIEKLKTRGDYEKELQTAINQLIHLIDHGQNCISCDKEMTDKKSKYIGHASKQAGHYHTRGGNKAVAYHLNNIYLQCQQCNEKLSGNIIGYNEGLRREFGRNHQRYVEEGLKGHAPLGLMKHELKEKAVLVRKLIREYKKEGNVRKLTPKERLDVREKYTNLIGIY